MGDTELHVLLARARSSGAADDHFALSSRAAQRAQRPQDTPLPPVLWRLWANPDDLAQQRWGVIAPEGERGDDLIELIRPLIERRQAQQGNVPVRVFRAPPVATQTEAAAWKRKYFNAAQDLEDDLPLYQLILGDLDEVPLSIQQVQSTDGLVGRLAFDRDEAYRAYVDKVARWEDQPSIERVADAILHTVHDQTPATYQGHVALMEPGRELLDKWHGRGALAAGEIRATGAAAPSLEEFWRVGLTARPSVLLSVSHGVGAPADGWLDAEEQRALQGAMSLGQAGLMTAEMMAGKTFMPGGVWFMVACFGAGTPAASEYLDWLRDLASAGDCPLALLEAVEESLSVDQTPFVAALPKAALANPEGPLAFIGHVDLAWSYAFLDQDAGAGAVQRTGRVMGAVQSILGGARVGLGFRALSRFFHEVNTELTALYAERAAPPGTADEGQPDNENLARRARLWMLRQDLAAYVLLGDPAVRLPLARAQGKGGARAPAPATRAPADAPAEPFLPDGLAELEKAVGQVLSRSRSPAGAARAIGVSEARFARFLEAYRRAGRAAWRALSGPPD